MFDQELECCGAEFEKNHISLIGLLTFSFPLLLICLFLRFLLIPIYFFKRIKILDSLIKANLKLISQKNILSRYKCQLASSLFKVTPRASGFVFKYFNFSILLFIWIVLIVTFYQVV
ncbi:MAG: hypothetical protein CES88_14260 [Halobacteriovorax sp. JY17]|nr:MAG: hypothetical protein CES88_14260 [Halobacteriovorax sp. JY17]